MSNAVTVPAGGSNITTLHCPTGKGVLGGGMSSSDDRLTVLKSFPITTSAPLQYGWMVQVRNPDQTNSDIYRVYITCATLG